MPDIVTYLSARPELPVTLAQLSQGLNVEAGRIQKALSNAVSGGAYGPTLECLHRGRVWMWHGNGHVILPPPAPEQRSVVHRVLPTTPPPTPQGLRKGDMVEVMGTTQDGDAVASDENGRLYRVVPL